MLAVFGMVFCFIRLRVSVCLAGSVGRMTVTVTCFGNALFHLWLRFVNTLSFMISWSWISRLGHGVCFGMVGCLFFLGSMGEGACNLLECALGRHSSDALMEWQLPVGFDAEVVARRVAAEPDVWTDGSLVEDKVSGASSAGAGCFTCRGSRLWANWRWGHLDEDAVASACRGFSSVPGPLQSVQKELSSGVSFLLCKLMMGCILGLTIFVLFGMLAASWMARLLFVLLNWLRMVTLFCC